VKQPSPSIRILCLVSTGLILSSAGSVRAQSLGPSGSGMGPGSMPGYNFSGVGSSFSGTAAYVPYGSMGGFVPYTPGPGGGVGVQPGMRSLGMQQVRPGGMDLMGTRSRLGLIRGQIMPLAPISPGGMGAGAGGGMGSMGGLIRRTPGGSTGSMARPPVGNYPFRQPPSLIGPATTTPSMSM
jgi:hypothetical protein